MFRGVYENEINCATMEDAPKGEYIISLTVAPWLEDMDDQVVPWCGAARCYGREDDRLAGGETEVERRFLWPDEREVVVELE